MDEVLDSQKTNLENRIDRAMAAALAILGGLRFSGFQPEAIADMAVGVTLAVERKVREAERETKNDDRG